MKLKTLVLAVTFIVTGIIYYYLSGKAASSFSTQNVVAVIDGDTLELDIGQRVRLKGINTPELGMIYSEEAKNFLKKEVLNKSVKLRAYGSDQYGRILAHVFIDNKNVNKELVENGLATLYYYEHDEYYSELKKAEDFARENKIGIWKPSPNSDCLELTELKYKENTERCSNEEVLKIKNNCNKELNITIKDDATHVYKETISANSVFTQNYSCIWNDDGDSLYVSDEEGMLMFWRY